MERERERGRERPNVSKNAIGVDKNMRERERVMGWIFFCILQLMERNCRDMFEMV